MANMQELLQQTIVAMEKLTVSRPTHEPPKEQMRAPIPKVQAAIVDHVDTVDPNSNPLDVDNKEATVSSAKTKATIKNDKSVPKPTVKTPTIAVPGLASTLIDSSKVRAGEASALASSSSRPPEAKVAKTVPQDSGQDRDHGLVPQGSQEATSDSLDGQAVTPSSPSSRLTATNVAKTVCKGPRHQQDREYCLVVQGLQEAISDGSNDQDDPDLVSSSDVLSHLFSPGEEFEFLKSFRIGKRPADTADVPRRDR
ncbi:unnamed protein product [Dibothriocephalus latus]|uniref:Uncharacterized protein n=1 Tax=Dibothriocephalus latus TaxID=60516 RepID=A0A3P7P4R6_DIBLA|nr:unnamed protein product [Dibothriocephalus latus]